MWSHYTGSHTGFCLGFQREHHFFTTLGNNNGKVIPLKPVTYSENRIPVKPSRFTPEESTKLLYTKSLDWQYEEEERLLRMLNLADKLVNIEPYPIALFKVPHSALAEIIIGIRIDQDIKFAITKFAKQNKIPIFQAVISRSTYNVERKKINY